MSDRLQELRRQRALVQEHLAWLDREVAALAGPQSAPSEPRVDPPVVLPAATVPLILPAVVAAPLAPEIAAVADSIIDEYRVPPETLKTDVKKGCFVYFFAALALVSLGVFGFYFALHHG